MRVAILLNARFPTEKAYGIQVMAMARGFLLAGAEVAVMFPRLTSEVPTAIEHAGKRVEFIPFGPRLTMHRPWMFHLFRLLGAMCAVRTVKAWRPDIVLANDPVQAAYLGPHVPVVWDLHDTPDPTSFWRQVLMRGVLRHARGIVSTNQLKLDLLKKMFGDLPPTVVLPNPVSLDVRTYRRLSRSDARAMLGIPEDEKVVVYAGQLYDWKGVDTLIAAAAYAPSHAVLHIVGGVGRDLERCRARAATLPSGIARIVFHGLRPVEEVPVWLRAADVVAVPNSGKFEVSVRDTNPLKLYEAMAAEAPVLASDLPAIREAAGASGSVVFVAADAPQVWGRAMGDLLADPSRLEAMRRATRDLRLMGATERAVLLIAFFKDLS